MYVLYTSWNSYAMTAQVMLEELGLDYELEWVTIHIPLEKKDKEFVGHNPNGQVPTLIGPEGTIYETGAILVRLAETHPEAGLIPALDDPRRPLFWQWHFYLVSTFMPEEFIQDGPDRYFPDAERQTALKEASMVRLRRIWRVLDDGIGDGPYFLGDQFTTVDISFALQACWIDSHPPEGLEAYPNALRNLRTVLKRPSVGKVFKDHKVEFQADL